MKPFSMNKLVCILLIMLIFSCAKKNEIQQTAAISCGQCNFDMQGDGCELAVKIDNKAYFVEGFSIDDFGDAHDEHTGFCSVVRKAKIEGNIVNEKFVASKIELQD